MLMVRMAVSFVICIIVFFSGCTYNQSIEREKERKEDLIGSIEQEKYMKERLEKEKNTLMDEIVSLDNDLNKLSEQLILLKKEKERLYRITKKEEKLVAREMKMAKEISEIKLKIKEKRTEIISKENRLKELIKF